MAKGYSKQIQLRIHESPEGSIFVNSDFLNSTNWYLSINSLNFPLFSRLPTIENSIYVSFSLVFALMG